MKKILLTIIFCSFISACQTAENTNVGNANTNANYNQNLELQKIRNQQKQQTSDKRNLNTAQNEIERENSNIENSAPRNSNKTKELHEKSHDIEPEKNR